MVQATDSPAPGSTQSLPLEGIVPFMGRRWPEGPDEVASRYRADNRRACTVRRPRRPVPPTPSPRRGRRREASPRPAASRRGTAVGGGVLDAPRVPTPHRLPTGAGENGSFAPLRMTKSVPSPHRRRGGQWPPGIRDECDLPEANTVHRPGEYGSFAALRMTNPEGCGTLFPGLCGGTAGGVPKGLASRQVAAPTGLPTHYK